VGFAHSSEKEFARLLDFYEVAWEYEPRAFAIEWGPNGAVAGKFRPDFYLPDEEIYIEITTMNQKLVTKKNGKVRRLRELYPDVRCKIFYQRDFHHLIVKYGLEEPADVEMPEAPIRIPGPPQITNLADAR